MDDDVIKFRPKDTVAAPLQDISLAVLAENHISPAEFEIPATTNDYLRQISEDGGVHSCLPTSVLNALIHLGVVSRTEAQRFQDRFTSDLEYLFIEGEIGGSRMKTLGYPLGKLLDELDISPDSPRFELLTRQFDGENHLERARIIRALLSSQRLIIAGNASHTRLVVGYDGETIRSIDPNDPSKVVVVSMADFVHENAEGDNGWLNLISLKEEAEQSRSS